MLFCEFPNDVWLRRIVKKECFVVSQTQILIKKKPCFVKNFFLVGVRTLKSATYVPSVRD